MIIKNGLVFDSVNPQPYKKDILVKDGKIAAIGENLSAPGEEVIDAEGLRVYAGFIDAHSHLGLSDYGMGYEGNDTNEYGSYNTAELRAIDGFYPQDKAIPSALRAGVTTAGVGPGSANVLGGTFMAIKLHGNCVDDMVINPRVAMKCAFGENPKRCYRDKGISTRMSTAAKFREALFNAREYLAKKEAAGDDPAKMPKYDMKMEALIPVLKKEIPLKAHAHRTDDICTAIRIKNEFDVNMTLEHCTEGHLIVKELVRAGLPVAIGPTLTDASKIELVNKTFKTPGVLADAGLQVSIITDAPVIPQQYLPLCAGLAVKAGMDPFKALQAITINPAKHLGIADRVGSLEVGKDADIVIADGDPLVSDTVIKTVILDGNVVV